MDVKTSTKVAAAKAKATSLVKKNFSLKDWKDKNNFSVSETKFKEDVWIPLSEAFRECTSLPGILKGGVFMLRGHSDTGKTTALIEAAVSAQKMGIIPVLLITEMKWSWKHVIEMGFQAEEVADPETGEIVGYEGDFIYKDSSSLQTIEDVAATINALIQQQDDGKLPVDLIFLWDSVGSVQSAQSAGSDKNNNQWNAGALSTQFAYGVNQRIHRSRKEGCNFTNTFVFVNKVWVNPPANPFSKPTMQCKGGTALYYDSTAVITFGNIETAGTNKISAIHKGKKVEFARRTPISLDKSHLDGVTPTKGKAIMTAHGFIQDDKKAIDKYKADYKEQWHTLLDSKEFDIVEE